MDNIIIRGAREHNLKNIDLISPRDKLIVFTGLSGSGKSSLAFDTIYAEGQRRYVESLSSYARQFIGQMEKPEVDAIEGLSPAISIDQKSTSNNPRSTVACISIAQMDATQFQSPTPLDAVLLDVPCSNTGVLRRKPDAKWSFDLKKLSELTAIQSKILHQSSLALKPNGRLVYSTCSIEQDENDLQIKAFLQSHPNFTLVKKQLILPDENHDGAFAALLQKTRD